MLIGAMREALGRYSAEELRRLIMALYKGMPKKLRDEQQVDAMITDLAGFEAARKAGPPLPELQILSAHVARFLEDAYQQNYLAPNTSVRKSERPKWRFIVKDFIKQLQLFSPDTKEGEAATDLLAKLYAMLAHACGYYLFNTNNPFRSVGIGQVQLYDSVVVRLLANGVSTAALRSAILLLVDGCLDPDTMLGELSRALVNRIPTVDGKELCIAQCQQLWDERAARLAQINKRSMDSMALYAQEEKLNRLVQLVFHLYVSLYECQSGIDWFQRHWRGDAEDKSGNLFYLLRAFDQPALWMRQYEQALSRKEKVRPWLKDVYQRLHAGGTWDEEQDDEGQDQVLGE
ncbi:MAG: hypothetical protein AB9880_03460 [Christensenellales bacterium]